ncbi:hypothetical protein LEP1GSC124_1810 [Leptospira interrogans serovar Pyrogenes str. 200701872]|uniref:Uncharacterized protein n=1 Tax=Leptospira interrogans serovar Pyrogenes str. 200701872 TaxID=1193029 RepID=M7A892_LEPIR|nr:hypothetical protein LEP1GSC124_1810 [Leptospira interrogans serovar Pyrogenes str. 200701872]
MVLFLVPGILFLLSGIWSYSAGISFQRITDTKGEDLDFYKSVFVVYGFIFGFRFLLDFLQFYFF